MKCTSQISVVALSALVTACSCSTASTPEIDASLDHPTDQNAEQRFDSSVQDLGLPERTDSSGAFIGFWAHSSYNLYRIDPLTLALTDVGPFSGDFNPAVDVATDIAINGEHDLFIVTYSKVMRVDPETAEATFLASFGGSSVVGLTFMPVSFDNPDGPERLVAGSSNQLLEVNQTTGAQTLIGTLSDDGQITFSGDLFYVRGVGIYATVNYALSGNSTSHLARIDEATLRATIIGPTTRESVWGLAYWGNTFYGFTAGGEMFTINPTDASPSHVGYPPGTQGFLGAGVTTRAPTSPNPDDWIIN